MKISTKCIENGDEPSETTVEPFQKIAVHIGNDTSFLSTAIKNVGAIKLKINMKCIY